MSQVRLFTAGLCIAVCAAVHAEIKPPMLIQEVAVSGDRIVFSWVDQLWSVPLSGGKAKKLLPGTNSQRFPAFSPDGKWLAYSGSVNGNTDVYTVPSEGGEPRRLTYHPKGDTVQGWSEDGKAILFASSRERDGQAELYVQAVDAPMPQRTPMQRARTGALGSFGRIVFSPDLISFSVNRRYYRGGMMSRLFMYEPGQGKERPLTSDKWNAICPMWNGDKLYHLSDRLSSFNLAVYDLKTGSSKDLTDFREYGATYASMAAGRIAYVRDGRIYLYDISSGSTREVPITIDESSLPAGVDQRGPRSFGIAPAIADLALSADGKSAAMEARGDIWLKPFDSAGQNLTHTPGVAERSGISSPDGKRIAYFSEASGNYALHIRDLGSADVKAIPLKAGSFYSELSWSPDGRHLAFADYELNLWLADVGASTARILDTSNCPGQELWQPRWYPNGRYVAYAKVLDNRVRTIFVADMHGAKTQVTDGMTPCEAPAFDAGGAYLYFIARPAAIQSLATNIWALESSVMKEALSVGKVFAASLRRDVGAPTRPLATSSEVELEGIRNRIYTLALPERDYRDIKVGKSGVLFLLTTNWGEAPGSNTPPSTLLSRFNLNVAPAYQQIAKDFVDYGVSADGSTILLTTDGGLVVFPSDVAPTQDPLPTGAKPIPITETVDLDIPAEWRMIYREAFRLMRYRFYDRNFHGRDLDAIEHHFETYLPSVVRRSDLNAVLTRAFGEVSISHLVVSGGDAPRPTQQQQQERTGLLGADISLVNGGYRVARIFRADDFYADSPLLRNPLLQPGNEVAEGEYILAVDGQDVSTARNFYSYFAGKAGVPTKIRVGKDPSGAGAREVTVTPLPGENSLRAADAARRNAEYVQKATNGRIAYVWVSGWGFEGYNAFYRAVNLAANKEGLIVDERGNGGGITSDVAVASLNAPLMLAYDYPYGNDFTVPILGVPGSKVLITNAENGSAAETFALMFKNLKTGTVVGRRTIGGGVGPALASPSMIDGGTVVIPNRGGYNPLTGRWEIENEGVMPDVDVDWTAADFAAGRDPQLAKAVEIALKGAKKMKIKKPVPPVHP